MHRINYFADVGYTCVGRGVHFHHVNVPPFHDRCAVLAFAARLSCRLAQTVQADAIHALCYDPRSSGFARPAYTCHHKRLRNPIRLKGVFQRAHHRVLADQIDECLRAVFAGEDLIGGGVGHVHFQRQSGLRRG